MRSISFFRDIHQSYAWLVGWEGFLMRAENAEIVETPKTVATANVGFVIVDAEYWFSIAM